MKKIIFVVFIFGTIFGLMVSSKLARITHIIHAKIGSILKHESKKPTIVFKYEENNSGQLMISDFENPADINKWSGGHTERVLAKEFFDQLGHCLKVTYPKGEYRGLDAYRTLPKDWSKYQILKFDIFNPSDTVIKFGILIRDEFGDSYPQRYDGEFALKPGINNFELNITGIKSNDKSRLLAMDKIKEVTIFLVKTEEDTTIYLNNIRLEREQNDFGAEMKNKENNSGPLILSDFNNASDEGKWDGVRTQRVLAKDFFNAEGHWLKVTYPKGQYPGLDASRTLPVNWSKYQTLKFDLYNPTETVIKFGIILKDDSGDSYPQRYDGEFGLKPGMNNFELNITGIKTNDKSRLLAMDKITEMILFLIQPQQETTLFLNNVRLESEQKIGIQNMYFFNFGTEESPSWPGSIKVTNKTKFDGSLGYGWTGEGASRAEDRQFPDPLFRSWVIGKEFKTNLPNGDYVVYMMLEDPGAWDYYQNYQERKVYAGDQMVVDDYEYSAPFFKDQYFKHLDTEDMPREDVWDTYIKTRFVPKIFKVTVTDGQLDLRFDPAYGYANTLSCLIIYPVEQSKKAEKYINELTEKRKKYFDSQYAEVISQQPDLDPQFDSNDYLLFSKSNLDPMYPNVVPTDDEILKEIDISAAQGESKPFNLDVYPLKDLGPSQVSLESLVNSAGNVIPPENITVRTTQYKLKLTGEKVYQMRGELLRKTDTWDIKKGATRQFWITVNVPENTVPGEYKGNVIFKTSNGSEQKIPIKLTVLPFKLDEPKIALGMFFFAPSYYKWFDDTDNMYWETIEQELNDQKNHGLNTVAIDIVPSVKGLDDTGKPEIDFESFDRFIALYEKTGFNKPIVDYGAIGLISSAEKLSENDDAKLTEILQSVYSQIKAHLESNKEPEIIFALGDELSNVGGKGIDYGIKFAKIAQSVPGIRTTAFLDSPVDSKIFPDLNISTINNGLKISQDLLSELKDSGSDLWFYNIGQDRFTFGFYLWKTKAKGRLQWHYQLPSVDPYFDLDGRESDYCASYPSLEGPINAVWFEWVREGVDDYRYLQTLDDLIKKVEALNNPAFASQLNEAKALMADIDSSIQVERDKNKWTPEDYSRRRKQIAEQIINLKKLTIANLDSR